MQFYTVVSPPPPPSNGHECDFILVRSGPFQKAGRSYVVFTHKPSEPVQNRFKIRMVRKSEPEIGPVRKRTIPFPYEQTRQVQFRSTFRTTFRTYWVSTGTRKCISLTLSQYIRETLFSCRSACVFFLFLETSFQILISVNPQTLFFWNYISYVFFKNFFNHKLSPFRRWSMNVVNCSEIFCMHVCIFGRNIISWMSEEILIFFLAEFHK